MVTLSDALWNASLPSRLEHLVIHRTRGKSHLPAPVGRVARATVMTVAPLVLRALERADRDLTPNDVIREIERQTGSRPKQSSVMYALRSSRAAKTGYIVQEASGRYRLGSPQSEVPT